MQAILDSILQSRKNTRHLTIVAFDSEDEWDRCERNERFRIAESFMESYSTVNSTGGSSVRNAVNRSSWVVAILHTNATRD